MGAERGARRRILGILGLGFLGGIPWAQETPPFEITPELLARVEDEALPAVRAALGVKLEGRRVRLGTTDEIVAALAAENRPILEHQVGAEKAPENARSFALQLAPALLAKYTFEKKEVLVQAATFARMARLLGIEELNSEATLRAVVLHELVHAADDERHDLGQLFLGCVDADAVRACNAVIEGHAQLVARREAARLGWTPGFETFTRAITATPSSPSETGKGSEILARTMSAFLGFSYVAGESFFVALNDDGGDEAVERAFREPPRDATMVSHPEWYLHPERRPRVSFDLEPALDAFRSNLEDGGWAHQRLSVATSDLSGSLAPLPQERIDAIGRAMRQNRVHVASLQRGLSVSQVVLGMFEFGSPEESQEYLASYRELQRLRDESMKEGAIRIVDATYTDLAPPGPMGVEVEKRVSVGGIQVDIASLCIVRGSLAVEALASNAPEWQLEELLEAALEALDTAEEHPRAAEASADR